MDSVKGLFFDVGGTVFDWKSTVQDEIERLAGELGKSIDSEHFADDWRKAMFRVHTRVRNGDLAWMNSDGILSLGLDEMTSQYPQLVDLDRGALIRSTWHRMNAFPGAAEAIARLRTKFTVVVLTILSWESIVSSSKAAAVQWDGILSCEFLGYYKPSLQAYRKGVALLGLDPSEAMMVAAHEADLAAARAAGMYTAHVGVPVEDFAMALGQNDDTPFDIQARDFEDLCTALGV